MKKFLLILCALLGTVGAWADTTVTLVDGTNAPFDTYGTRNIGVSPQTFTSKASSGLAGIVLSAPVIDRATWWNLYCLAIKNSAVNTDENIVITAPTGYTIKSISMSLRAYSSSTPYDVTVNGSTTSITGAAAKDYNCTVNDTSFSFTINSTGESVNWLAVTSLSLVLESQYDAALTALGDGGDYRIFTRIGGTKYYVTTNGYLTSSLADGGKFTFEKVDKGEYQTYGYKIKNNNSRFTNTNLSNNYAVLNTGHLITTTGNDRNNWEAQVLFKLGDKYAIRACNSAHATSSWGDAGRVFWTWAVEDVPVAQYSYDPNYTWELEAPGTPFTATYNLYYGGNKVDSKEVSVEPGYATLFAQSYQDDALFTYSCNKAIIEEGDTEIDVTATWKGFFDFSEDYENAVWYYANLRGGKWLRADESNKDSEGRYTTNSINEKTDDYKWAFIGNPFNFTIVNKGAGEGKYLYKTTNGNGTNFATMESIANPASDEKAQWIAAASGNGFSVRNVSGTHLYINDSGGNGNLGIWDSSYGATDNGSRWAIDAVPASEVTVTYNVLINGNIVNSASDKQPIGDAPTLPASLAHALITSVVYDVDILTAQTTTVNATISLPFEVSANYASAHWYDMAMRSTWYVTTDDPNGDGSYNSVNANAIGLVKDSYQWAFIGNPYDGFKIINKAAGDGYSFGWTNANQGDKGIPTVMDDAEGYHTWKIVASTNTSVPANSFCLNVPGTNLYINQYGGAGGSLKFWDSGSNVSDSGSAFTVFDIPDNFAEFTGDIETVMKATGYFTPNAATKALWNDEYKTNCPYDKYVEMQEAINDEANWSWPETGYYLIESNNYKGYYMAYKDFGGGAKLGTITDPTSATAIVKLTAGEGHKYTISVADPDLYASAPATSEKIGLAADPVQFLVEMQALGICSFTKDGSDRAIHCADSQDFYNVGWDNNAAASLWKVTDATSINVEITSAGYATLYVPFALTIPDGIEANTVTISDNNYTLVLTPITGTIPAGTPVLLSKADGEPADAGTYTFTITSGGSPVGDNVLEGTYVDYTTKVGDYVLQNHYVAENQEYVVGFYHVEDVTPKVPANRAYIATPSNVKAFFLNGGDTDAIKSVFSGIAEGKIFDLSGRKVAKMQKGNTYIVNGKKVNVK